MKVRILGEIWCSKYVCFVLVCQLKCQLNVVFFVLKSGCIQSFDKDILFQEGLIECFCLLFVIFVGLVMFVVMKLNDLQGNLVVSLFIVFVFIRVLWQLSFNLFDNICNCSFLMFDIIFYFVFLIFVNFFFESVMKFVFFYQGILILYCFEVLKL